MGRVAMARLVFCILSIMIAWTACLGSESSDVESKEKKSKRPVRVRERCAPELGLVTEQETSIAYAKHALRYCNTSSPWAEEHLHVREVLGFVSPWHNYSYRAANNVHRKLAAISPLWLRVLPPRGGLNADKNQSFEIVGLEFVQRQQAWSRHIVEGGCQLLPHISLEGFDSLKALRNLMATPEALAEKVAEICQSNGFAGIVFDVRLALFSSVKALLVPLVAEFGRRFRAAGHRFILSVPAEPQAEQRHAPEFDAGDAAAVAPHIDGVIVGTRDYSRKEKGPSAPLPWVRSSIKRLLAKDSAGKNGLRPEHLFLEIPLYGRAFQDDKEEGQPILTAELVKAFSRNRPEFIWDSEAAEHSTSIANGKTHFSMPTLAFVSERLRLARSLGVGVALRDLGTGLDYAFDLLAVRSKANSQKSPSAASAELRSDL